MIRRIALTVPTVGTNLNYTKPLGKIWDVLGLDIKFTTNATAANRTMKVTFDTQTYTARSAQTASKAVTYHLRPFVTDEPADNIVNNGDAYIAIGEGNILLIAAETITTLVTNLVATVPEDPGPPVVPAVPGDVISSITLIVNERD